MKIILFGPPGAGKGTQSSLISEHYGLKALSTGDMLRAAASDGGELGRRVASTLQSGGLIPDELMTELVCAWVETDAGGDRFLLDGFPRTIPQAEGMRRAGIVPDVFLSMELAESELLQRLSQRRIHPASGRTYHLRDNPPQRQGVDDVTGEPLIQRQDDKAEVVRKRLEIFQKKTRALVQYYRQQGEVRCLSVDGLGSIEEVFARIRDLIDTSKSIPAHEIGRSGF